MARPDILMVDGHAFSWRRRCDLRRQQIEEWAKIEARQPALFELKTDCRPVAEPTATERMADCRELGRISASSIVKNNGLQKTEGIHEWFYLKCNASGVRIRLSNLPLIGG